jgi:hypothetical protein
MSSSSKNIKNGLNQIVDVAYRVPKKNHDAMVNVCKQSNDLFKKKGVLLEVFLLNNIKTYEDQGYTNIAQTIPALQDEEEEVWLEVQYYKDRKQLDELLSQAENNEGQDEVASQIGNAFMNIKSLGPSLEGEFNRIII